MATTPNNPSVGMFSSLAPGTDPLAELYSAYLNRAPDASGREYWSNMFGSNISNRDIEDFKGQAMAETGGKVNEWGVNPYFTQVGRSLQEIDPTMNLQNVVGAKMQALQNWYDTPYAGPGGAPAAGATGGTGAGTGGAAGAATPPPPNYSMQTIPGTNFQIPSPGSAAYGQNAAQSTLNMVSGLQALQGAGRGNEGVYIQGLTDAGAKLDAAKAASEALGWSLEKTVQHMYGMTPEQLQQAYAANYTKDFTPITSSPTYVAPLPEYTAPVAAAPAPSGDALRDLYVSVLGREPDAAGYQYWSGLFGGSIEPSELETFKSVASQTEPKR